MANDPFTVTTFSTAPTITEDVVEENYRRDAQIASDLRVQELNEESGLLTSVPSDIVTSLMLKLSAQDALIKTLQQKVIEQDRELEQFRMFIANFTVNLGSAPGDIPGSNPTSLESARPLRRMPSDVAQLPSLATTGISPQNSFGSLPPKTPKASRVGLTAPATPSGTFGSSRRRHVRTKTPEQRSLQKMMKGTKLFTIGIQPQDDRGLIADFFDEIYRWARLWTARVDGMTPETITKLADLPSVTEFFKESLSNDVEEVHAIIGNDVLRAVLVGAIVAKDIVYNTMCDHFLYNSGHPNAASCDRLFNQYLQVGPDDVAKKHEILVQQNTLYSDLHEAWSFRRWRDQVAEEKSLALFDKIRPFVSQQAPALGLEGVLAHYIKGYRIGFRMRMDTKKWVLSWPHRGEDFNPMTMVNEARYICGSANDTNMKTIQFPQNFTVRFARSPLMTRTDFALGYEDKQVIHSGLVHLKEKQRYTGAEAERKRSYPVLRVGNITGNGNGNGTYA